MIEGQTGLSTNDMKLVNNWLNNAQHILLPATCVLCGAPGHEDIDLCPACQADLPRIKAACRCCGLPLSKQEQAICGQCLQTPRPYQHTLSPFFYQPPLIELISQFKFHHRLAMARIFAHLLGDHILARRDKPEVLIPVPLHPRRLRERGYNQSLEIARLLGRQFGIPVDHGLCHRSRYTQSQSGLTATDRKRNIKNAFKLNRPCHYRHLAIIDDVITTGHTVGELAKCLQKSGADRIDVWSVARAVPD